MTKEVGVILEILKFINSEKYTFPVIKNKKNIPNSDLLHTVSNKLKKSLIKIVILILGQFIMD